MSGTISGVYYYLSELPQVSTSRGWVDTRVAIGYPPLKDKKNVMEQDSLHHSFTLPDSVKAASPKCLVPKGPLLTGRICCLAPTLCSPSDSHLHQLAGSRLSETRESTWRTGIRHAKNRRAFRARKGNGSKMKMYWGNRNYNLLIKWWSERKWKRWHQLLRKCWLLQAKTANEGGWILLKVIERTRSCNPSPPGNTKERNFTTSVFYTCYWFLYFQSCLWFPN